MSSTETFTTKNGTPLNVERSEDGGIRLTGNTFDVKLSPENTAILIDLLAGKDKR